jgi:hypothetical protein
MVIAFNLFMLNLVLKFIYELMLIHLYILYVYESTIIVDELLLSLFLYAYKPTFVVLSLFRLKLLFHLG